jgi:dihydropteroate synthase
MYYTQPARRPAPPPVETPAGTIEFGERYYTMGILNVTPDSFSDGGDYNETEAAIERGIALAESGADILDVGGESTRPGAEPVPVEQEIERVLPVVEGLADATDAFISIDTRKAPVATEAVDKGAAIVNDVSGLGYDDNMATAVAESGAALVMMHMQGTPETMQDEIEYDDLISDIHDFFARRISEATDAGVPENRIILDPGIGFGKTVTHNYRLLRELSAFFGLGRPLLLGPSRKSFIGAVVDRPPKQRVWGTAATVTAGLLAGGDIVRVHDVDEMIDVVRVTEAVAGMDPHPPPGE